jgi:hypothetical protein
VAVGAKVFDSVPSEAVKIRMLAPKGKKVFFFEKKKQKTFTSSGWCWG